MSVVLTGRKALFAGMLSATALIALPGTAAAQLASCAAILTAPPLAGNPAIASATSVQATTGGRAYCNVSVVYRDPALVGEAAGYAPGVGPSSPTTTGTPGAYQHIRMGFGLPLNTNTGAAAWGGRVVQTAGGLDQGSVAGFTGYISATNPSTGVGGQPGQAMIGLSTDSGHGTADSGSGDAYGYVQGQRPNYGKLKDWAGGRAYCTAVKLVKQMALAYYGRAVERTYWEGFSGGGQMGTTQVVNCPEEYDGALIGSPSREWQQFRLTDSYQAMVMKKAVQLGIGFTSAQLSSAYTAGIAYCMNRGAGGVNVGGTNILHDPRSCDWKATMHVCGAPTAPATNCLTAGTRQAELLQQVIDGPKNSYGKLIFYPYSWGIAFSNSTAVFSLSTPQVMRWNHYDSTFNATTNLFLDAESIALAGNPANAISFEDEMFLGTTRMSDYADTSDPKIDGAKARGMKIILTHGTHDNLILYRKDPAYYRQVATYFGGGVADYESLKTWFRLYLMPGAGHEASNFLPQLISWTEGGPAPEKLTRTSSMRAVCPYPQYAQYSGTGSTTDAANFTCGGNLEADTNALCSMIKTPYKGEKSPITNTLELNIDPRACQRR
jgi:feruloyl esterase